MGHFVHPTVDTIYHEVHKEVPTLSKTTVYNTLNHFVDAGLVRIINIEDNETRYDINVHDHGHFKCVACGAIYDFPVDMERLGETGLAGFAVQDRNVYFKGTCPACLGKKTLNIYRRYAYDGTRNRIYRMPLIGDDAPAFTANTTQGEINFPGGLRRVNG